jgi:thioredoxin reductase (NADPH)
MPVADERREQMFPTLSPHQAETARRFASGPAQRFEPGQMLFDVGQRDVPSWLVLEGSIVTSRRDGLGVEETIVAHQPRQFTGEVSQLSGGGTLAAGTAGDDGALALPFDAAHLRALIIGSADLGETIMRAFILRRVGLIEAGAEGGAGSVLVGERDSADVVRLSGFLTRNGYPFHLVAACETEGQELVHRLGMSNADLPLMICPNGNVLRRPSDAEAASCLGIVPDLDPDTVYDVAIVGAGPAGLATAVYGASEGLSVLVLDTRAFGGQAGASARIENYLGFPTGISGQALAGRAFTQAMKFGAQLAIPVTAGRLLCEVENGEPFALRLDEERTARARSVVIASGARYRRPDLPRLEEFEGAGISYWASPIEAKLCEGEEVALVGGGNSAGQAVVYLAPQVERLHLVVRRPLRDTMSRYLIERIEALPNVEIHEPVEITGLEGDSENGLTAALFRNKVTGQDKRCVVRHMFLFIGADPNTDWLDGCVKLDGKGFVVTGEAGRMALETSRAGVFAVGDVRAGSVKRVAAAVGEGAAAVAQIHALLAREN